MRPSVIASALLALAASSPVRGASDADCRQFHEECESARALGHRDVGICRVEEAECPHAAPDPSTSGVKKTPPLPPMPQLPGRPGGDAETSVGP